MCGCPAYAAGRGTFSVQDIAVVYAELQAQLSWEHAQSFIFSSQGSLPTTRLSSIAASTIAFLQSPSSLQTPSQGGFGRLTLLDVSKALFKSLTQFSTARISSGIGSQLPFSFQSCRIPKAAQVISPRKSLVALQLSNVVSE
ncbi:unnamed protein product [Sympodiomycopsis kandeliae]